VSALASLLVRAYRAIVSPLLGPRCKYHPTCSQYALDAFREFGFVRGLVLVGWRLLRCNPWSHGGVDYVAQQTFFRPRRPRAAGEQGA
jgi:putative membrane protein insertion efficiency factor